MKMDEIVDGLNIIISAQGAYKRKTIWDSRLKKELKRLEAWLKSKQKDMNE